MSDGVLADQHQSDEVGTSSCVILGGHEYPKNVGGCGYADVRLHSPPSAIRETQKCDPAGCSKIYLWTHQCVFSSTKNTTDEVASWEIGNRKNKPLEIVVADE